MDNTELIFAQLAIDTALDDLWKWQRRFEALIEDADSYAPEAFMISFWHLRRQMRDADFALIVTVCRFQRLRTEQTNPKSD